MSEYGDEQFACCDYDGDRPMDDCQGHWRYVEMVEGGVSDYRKAEKGTADQEFIGQWIDDSAEPRDDVVGSCDFAVDNVGKACGYEYDKRCQKEGCGFILAGGWRVNDHRQKDRCQHKAQHREGVWHKPDYSSFFSIGHSVTVYNKNARGSNGNYEK